MNKSKYLTMIVALVTNPLYAEETEKLSSIYQLTLAELLEVDVVSIATGSKKSLSRAPSVASVITAEDIKRLGARTLSEVLSNVPGLYVSFSAQISAAKYIVRGIATLDNPQILVLVDGTPISSVIRSDRHVVWGQFPLQSISRIEVIRGPGSALYGADAFAGVINVITKGIDTIGKPHMGARFGSFNTQDVWASSGFEVGDLTMSFSGEYTTTDGHKAIIESDAQSNLDPALSLAPGPVNLGFRNFNLRFDLNYHDVNFKLGFHDVDNLGTGKGGTSALDPIGKLGGEKLQITLDYQKQINKLWHSKFKLSHYRSNQRVEELLVFFPPGALAGFEDGFIGSPQWAETNDIIQSRFSYSGFSDQTITLGGGYRVEDLYETRDTNNFSVSPGELVDVADSDYIFIEENKRDSYFAYLQDEYQLAKDWELTGGIRFDHYSDFGSTTNPRLALVWATKDNLSTKFLYGRAFRKPGFNELIAKSNPLALGNNQLKPETIDTFETALSYQVNHQVQIDLNLYHFAIDRLIDFKPDHNAPTLTAQNAGKVKGYGLEMELDYKISELVKLSANYAYQKTTDKGVNDDLGGAPNHQLYVRFEWQINDAVLFNTQLTHVGEIARSTVDSRAPVDASTRVDLSLRLNKLFDTFNVQIKANNLFDEDIRHPSNGPTVNSPTVAIANDLPQAGRAFYLGLSKTF